MDCIDMKIYINEEYICYVEPAQGRIEIETDFFNGKCKTFIEGYRFVPSGQTWTRSDGVQFVGEMIAPATDYTIIASAQTQYEADQLEQNATLTEIAEALGIVTEVANDDE